MQQQKNQPDVHMTPERPNQISFTKNNYKRNSLLCGPQNIIPATTRIKSQLFLRNSC